MEEKKTKIKKDLFRGARTLKSNSQNRGITLVALVITIVILIILASVAINLTLGNDGIFNRAKTATQEYTNAQAKEETEIAKVANEIENYVGGNRDTDNYVLETGENYYCKKYNNGNIELFGKTNELSLTTSNTAWGGLYNAPTQTINFPMTFTSIQYINLISIASTGTSYTNITWHTLTNNSVRCEMWRPDKNISFNATIYYTIIGK